MTYGQVKDVVREHFGRIGWPTAFMTLALDGARRDVETTENFYWMRDTTTFNTVSGTQSYIIGDGAAINEANFKDLRAVHSKESTSTVWSELDVGTITQEEAGLTWSTDSDGMPGAAILDNSTLVLYPTPDAVYNMKLWHWNWTENPAGNNDSDELTSRFPDALIYGALMRGAEQYDHNYPDADRWAAKCHAVLTQLHRYNLERERQDLTTLIPMTGPYQRRRRLGWSRDPYSWV